MAEELKPAVQGKGFFEKFIGIYFSPRETFESLDRKPDWIVPLIVLAVLSALFIIITFPVLRETQLQMLIEKRGMSAEQAEEVMAKTAGFQKISSPVGAVFGTFLAALIISGILYFGGNIILGGESTFKKVLSVYSYTGLGVGLIGLIVKTPLILSKGTMHVQTSLALLVSEESRESFLYRLLARFDIFTIWQLLLWAAGLAVIYKFTLRKSLTFVIVLWVVWIVISLALGGLFGRLGIG